MSGCNCTLKQNWDPGVEPCNAESTNGRYCTKPEGHTGDHSACTPGQHPAESWDSGSE